jgi:hypothetical protein
MLLYWKRGLELLLRSVAHMFAGLRTKPTSHRRVKPPLSTLYCPLPILNHPMKFVVTRFLKITKTRAHMAMVPMQAMPTPGPITISRAPTEIFAGVAGKSSGATCDGDGSLLVGSILTDRSVRNGASATRGGWFIPLAVNVVDPTSIASPVAELKIARLRVFR